MSTTILIVGVFTLAQLAARPWVGSPPFSLYYPAIILCSLYGYGLLSVGLTIVIAQLTFPVAVLTIPPRDLNDFTRAVIFFIAAATVHWLTKSRSRAEAALKEAVRARDEFIGVCSHELKTPITSMKLQFQAAGRMMAKGDTRVYEEAAVRKRITNANRQLDRMASLIDQMLEVARLGEGPVVFEMKRLDIVPLVSDVASRLEEQFAFAGVSLRLDLPASCEASVDPFRFEQVVVNLLTNALKYGQGKPVCLRVESAPAAPRRIIVQDQGEGIAPENLERIFSRFERVNPSPNVTGLGLGLYICRRIVEAHGGRIWAESTPGRGSRFILELP